VVLQENHAKQQPRREVNVAMAVIELPVAHLFGTVWAILACLEGNLA